MSETKTSETELKFYNYQEYSVKKYEPIRDNNKLIRGSPLVATHFSNPYIDTNSELYRKTRIVRIPRTYTQEVCFPQFSTFMPGFEPAALIDPKSSNTDELSHSATGENISNFLPLGKTKTGQLFGRSSVSPLSDYLTNEEFTEIVERINAMLMQAYESFTWYNIITTIFHFLTIQIFQQMGILKDQATIKLIELDNYVSEVNTTILSHKNIKLVKPSKNGYLSLDFEIPCPADSNDRNQQLIFSQ